MMLTRPWLGRLLVAVALTVAALLPLPLLQHEARAVETGSQLIGCDQADSLVTLTASAHLDPSCTWTRGVEIVASGVVLDCQGAHIATTDRRYGILITAPTDVALSDITVRSCHVEGFLNNVHIMREGFRDLAEGQEYDHVFSNIVVEDSTLLRSRGVGLFVDAYVTGVTLRRLRIEGAGSTGIYLEAGSKDVVVEDNDIVDNGYRENGPSGQLFELAGLSFWFWGTGREGLAIDGSRDNRVVGNRFSGNSAGAIFLYKNCGEFVNQRPGRWWHRRYGADGNLIEGNTIVGGENGVWIGSRMGENTMPMDCSDTAYYSDALNRIVPDYARDNVVRGNVFRDVTYGVRVEDDRSVVADNEFTGDDPAQQAVIVGTPWRTTVLGLPVDGTAITGNRSSIAGNKNPYRWTHGHQGTTFADNQSLGRIVGFCEGEPPRRNALIFVLAFEVADPENPPTGGPPVFPPPEPLPPCPTACASPAVIADPLLAIRRLGSPAGDDTLVFAGEMTLPHPYGPAIDPVEAGLGIVIRDAGGDTVLDLTVPGGAYDAAARVGWRAMPSGTWRFVDRSASPPGGITRVTLQDLSRRSPGLVRFRVRGVRGSYAVGETPLAGLLVVDPPTAETGQCGEATFAGTGPSCSADAWSVVCK